MTTLTSKNYATILKSEDDLFDYFQRFAKKRDEMRVGLEAEFFAVDKNTGRALPYHGPVGIHEILKALSRRFGYDPIEDEENIIGLVRGQNVIGLEPGGQIELSAPPVANVFDIDQQVQNFLKEIREIQPEFSNVAWLAVGIHPFSKLDEIPWVPKRRYSIMAEYLKTRGTLSHRMMKQTATNQINVDYLSEENAMANLRVALGITSIVTAIFANSSFSEGRPNGFCSERLEIWNHMDPDRSGLMIEFTRPGRIFRDYLEYLLEMPVIFILREGKWHAARGLTFRRFIKEGYQGMQATLGDFELHLSTAFPEARLKQYLEVRGVDGQSPDLIPAVAAFWKGILYSSAAADEAWRLVSFASEAERRNLHRAVPREGLRAKLGARPILPIARELVEISCASLARQTTADQTRDECVFLNRIRQKITRPGKSPGEILIEEWNGELGKDPRRLIGYLDILSIEP